MNELKVSLENIIPLTYARDHFSQIVAEVQKDRLFILTKGGKPAVAIIDAKYLESITGGQIQKADIREEIKKSPEKVGLPPMVEHPPMSSGPGPTKPVPPPPAPKPITPAPPPFKPFEKPPSTPLGTSQAKPAGFAAPQPPKPKEEKPLPPPPEIEPQPKPTPPPPPPPPKPVPPPKPLEPKPMPKSDELEMPKENVVQKPAGIPNKPLITLPPVQKKEENNDQVSVEFAPDDSTLEQQKADGKTPDGEKTALDDKNPPAQYAGEKEEPEPEDMALD